MIWLIRHGETEWSLSGAHTGRTDLPLTAEGEKKAVGIRAKLEGRSFALVLTSPMQRARRTCDLPRRCLIERRLRFGAYRC